MHIDILILVKALSKFLMYDITFIFYADIATDRELKTSTLIDVDVTANDVEIPTLR